MLRDENLERVLRAFDYKQLTEACEMHETEFAKAFGMMPINLGKPKKDKKKMSSWWEDHDPFYAFKDNGSDVLAVAHLDTVMAHKRRGARFLDTEDGPVVYSGALDDRLGAYTILNLLPNLDINVDVLLSTGEESGQSTAQFFEPPREYNWMIEFDRGGTDVVMYQYEDDETKSLVRDCGAKVGDGIFSDISYMDHLEIKGFNWGVGYQDYHGPRSHAFLEDYWSMIAKYIDFHAMNEDNYMPHDNRIDYRKAWGWSSTDWSGTGWSSEDMEEDEEWRAYLRANNIESGDNDSPDDDSDDAASEDFERVNEFCLRQQEREAG